MVSLFYARRYPAGREVKLDDQLLPNGEHRLSSEIANQNYAGSRRNTELIGFEQIHRSQMRMGLRRCP